MSQKTHVAQTTPFRWEGIPVLAYKEDGGTHFKAISQRTSAIMRCYFSIR